MARSLIAGAGILAALLGAGCGADARYLPLAAGARWDYRVAHEGPAGDRPTGFSWEVRSRMPGDQYLLDVTTEKQAGTGIQRELTHAVYGWAEEGLWIEDLSMPENLGRTLLIRSPLEPGAEWVAGRMKGRVLGKEDLKTPAQAWRKALRIRYELLDAPEEALELWLVRDVGIVRQESSVKGRRAWTADLVQRSRGRD